MIYSTLIGKTVHCERWDLDIHLSAKYILSDNPDTPYEARFSFATCPLAENCKISPDEQKEEFKHLRCLYSGECTLLQEFKPVVDIRKQDC